MCVNPYIYRKPDGTEVVHNCGHCLPCLHAKQNELAARMVEEARNWCPVEVQHGSKYVKESPIIFFTLTYSDQFVPKSYLLVGEAGTAVLLDSDSYEFWKSSGRVLEGAKFFPLWRTIKEPEESLHSRYLDAAAELRSLGVFGLSTEPLSGDLVQELFDRRKRKLDFLLQRTPYYEDWLNFEHSAGKHDHGQDFDALPRLTPTEWRSMMRSHPLEEFFSTQSVLFNSSFRASLVLEFTTVDISHVQDWLKASRIAFDRDHPEFAKGNPRQIRTWDNFGETCQLPSVALTKNVKYFIAPEYGPDTRRPHYHGMMYGVTMSEFLEYFAKRWQQRFGLPTVQFDSPGRKAFTAESVDASSGSPWYTAKYSGKGCCDNPLCCRDYFYFRTSPSGVEYRGEFHNCRYNLRNLQNFGYPLDLVRPCKQVRSQGLGASYCFNTEILNYFGSMLVPMLDEDSGTLRYFSVDNPSAPGFEGIVNLTVPDLDSLLCESSIEVLSGSVNDSSDPHEATPAPNFSMPDSTRSISCLLEHVDDGLYIRKYISNRLIGKSFIPASAIIDNQLFNFISRKRYERTRAFFSRKTGEFMVRTTKIPVPRYYRKWLVSPLASLARQTIAKCKHPSLHEVESAFVESGRTRDQAALFYKSIMARNEDRSASSATRIWKSSNDMYSHSSRDYIHGID